MLELSLVIVYSAIVIAIGYYHRHIKNDDDFVIAERRVKKFGTIMTISATITTESLVFFSVALTVAYGPLGAMFALIGPTIALLVMSFVAPRVHADGKFNRFVSIAEYCRGKWGNVIGQIVRLLFMCFLAWIIILQINLNGSLLSGLLHWSSFYATFLTVGIVLIYLFLGGYRSVVKTDIFQGLLLFAFILLPFFIDPRPDLIKALDIGFVNYKWFLLLIMSFAMVITRPEMWQRMYSAESGQSAAKSFRIVALINIVFGCFLFYYALAVTQAVPEATSIQAFATGYRTILPTYIAAFFPVLLLAAMMSTLDSAAFLLAVDLTSLHQRFLKRRVLWTRIFLVTTLCILGIISLTVFDALSFAYKIDGLVALTMIPLVISFWTEISRKLLSVSFLIGLAAYVTQILIGMIDRDPAKAIYPALLTGAIIISVYAFKYLLRRFKKISKINTIVDSN